jgi:hypothetical protein
VEEQVKSESRGRSEEDFICWMKQGRGIILLKGFYPSLFRHSDNINYSKNIHKIFKDTFPTSQGTLRLRYKNQSVNAA